MCVKNGQSVIEYVLLAAIAVIALIVGAGFGRGAFENHFNTASSGYFISGGKKPTLSDPGTGGVPVVEPDDNGGVVIPPPVTTGCTKWIDSNGGAISECKCHTATWCQDRGYHPFACYKTGTCS